MLTPGRVRCWEGWWSPGSGGSVQLASLTQGLLAPRSSSTIGATAHLATGRSPHLPPTKVCGVGGGGCGVHPLNGQGSLVAWQAAATCCPHMAGQTRGTGRFAPRFGGHQSWPPPCLQCLPTPQSPALQ